MQHAIGYSSYSEDPPPDPPPDPPIIITPYPDCGTLTIVGPEDDNPDE